MQRDEDPAAMPEEHEQAPERQGEYEAAQGPRHEEPRLPGDEPPPEPIHKS